MSVEQEVPSLTETKPEPEVKTKFRVPKEIRPAVNALLGAATSLALLADPSPVAAQPERPTSAQINPDIIKSEIEAYKVEMEREFNIILEGEWSLNELSMMRTSLDKLPPSFTLSHPGKLATLKVDRDDYKDNGECNCQSYFSNESAEKGEFIIRIGTEFFKDQRYLDRVVTHEAAHGKSLIIETRYEYNSVGYRGTIVWYQDEVEEILGKSFRDFRTEVTDRIQTKYPRSYEYLVQLYNKKLSPYNKVHGPETWMEMNFSENYKTLSKVDRWGYALDPAEFIGVMSEWYIEGEEYFMERCEGIIDAETASKIYNFMQNKFFEGYEYDSERNPINPMIKDNSIQSPTKGRPF